MRFFYKQITNFLTKTDIDILSFSGCQVIHFFHFFHFFHFSTFFPLFRRKIHFFHFFHFFIHFFQYFLIFWKINNNFRKKDIYFEFYGCLLDWLKSFYSQFSFSIDQTFSNLSPYLLQIVYSYFILLFWLHKFNKYTFSLTWSNFGFCFFVI